MRIQRAVLTLGFVLTLSGCAGQLGTSGSAVFVGSMVGGAAIGAAVRSEHWRRVPMSSLRVGVVALPAGRLGVGATFSLQH